MVKTEPFEVYHKRYEEWFIKYKHAYESEILALKRMLPNFSSGVEIGAGTGRYALPLGIRMGLEPAKRPSVLALSRGLEVIRGIAEEMPFKTSSFDLELMVTTICFLDDIWKALLEVKRTLKPDGYLITGYVDKDSKLGRAYQQRKEENPFYGEATFYGTSEIVKILTKIGFGKFSFVQTIFKELEEIKSLEPVKDGYGEGSFVVIRATPLTRY